MKVAFIGGGNMAAALLGGLLGQRVVRPTDVHVVEPDAVRCAELQRRFSVVAATTPGPVLAEAEIVVLAVKPQQMRTACADLRPWIGRSLVISIAAGIRATDLARWLGTEHIVRAMPNTPALVGKGVSGLVALPSVTADERIAAERILEAVGRAVWVEHEQQLDAVTALSGSGPAYVFYFIEALLDAGRELGLSAEQTRALVIETFIGASALAATRPEPVATLRAQVTSQGGTTAAALTRLEQSEVKKNIVAAIHAACIRAQELGDEFGR